MRIFSWIVAICLAGIFIGCQSNSTANHEDQTAAPAASPPPPATAPAALAADVEFDELTPDEGNLRALVELVRHDLRLHKALLIAQNLPLSDDEAAEFWPIEREYEQDLAALNDRKLAMIRTYFVDRATLDDATARKLASDAFDLESRRTELKRKYFKRFAEVLPASKAARFFQIDNQLNMLVDLQIAAALPLIK